MEVQDIPGRGLGVVATRTLQSGEVIVNDLPILLYPQASAIQDVCSFCLRWLSAPGKTSILSKLKYYYFTPNATISKHQPILYSLNYAGIVPIACSSCASAGFCSPQCAAAAATDPASHNPLVCRSLAACNITGLSDEDQSALHYLLRACSLLLAAQNGTPDATSAVAAASRYAQLTSLAGAPPSTFTDIPVSTAVNSSDSVKLRIHELHGRIHHALSIAGIRDLSQITSEVIQSLLERDAVNSYGIAAPLLPGSDSEEDRKLRGSGLYPSASRVNHECLPNAARFDAFDAFPNDGGIAASIPGANTALQLRMRHALPAGEEVTQSYFPLTWTFYQRQERCREQYGFVCACPRCQEEATWPPEERGDDDDVASGGDAPSKGVEFADAVKKVQVKPNADVADAGYIHVFLFKYVCPRDGCGGTMAPVSGQSDVLQCNVCERQRTEAEFLAELEASF